MGLASRSAASIRAARESGALSKERIADALKHRFFLRLHMFVILGGTFAAGLLTTVIVMPLTRHQMAFRYGLAVTASFAVFLGLVRLWLAYIAWCAQSERASRSGSTGSGDDWFDCFCFNGDGGTGFVFDMPSFGGGSKLDGGGGKFGGGGASGSWGDADAEAPAPSTVMPLMSVPPRPASTSSPSGRSVSSSGSKSGGGLSLDFDGDAAILLLVIALALAIAAAALYIIYAAPVILTEAAFNAALAGTLARRAKNISHSGTWEGSVTKATALPFLAILVLAVVLGHVAQKHCPNATRLKEAMYCAGTQ